MSPLRSESFPRSIVFNMYYNYSSFVTTQQICSLVSCFGQAFTGSLFITFVLGTCYRSASPYHSQRRGILHAKNYKGKVSCLPFLIPFIFNSPTSLIILKSIVLWMFELLRGLIILPETETMEACHKLELLPLQIVDAGKSARMVRSDCYSWGQSMRRRSFR